MQHRQASMTQSKTTHVADDEPKTSKWKTDLEYFERIGLPMRALKIIRSTGIKQVDGNKQAYNSMKNLFDKRSGSSLMIGEAGTGKTLLASWLIHQLAETRNYNQLEKYKFVNVPKLLFDLKCNFDKRSYENEQIVDKLCKVDFLVLDDLGAEKSSDWVAETIYIVINSRYDRDRSTIITTNLEPAKLAERLGDRIVSRLVEMCDVVRLEGKDWRLK